MMDHFIIANCLWERRSSGGIPRDDSFWEVSPITLEEQGYVLPSEAHSPYMILLWTTAWSEEDGVKDGHPFSLEFRTRVGYIEGEYAVKFPSGFSYVLYEKVL